MPVDKLLKHDAGHVKGQEAAKRAVMIAAAGGHSLALCGPPGHGKSMLLTVLRDLNDSANGVEAVAIWPCPCGYRNDPRRQCDCHPRIVEKHLEKKHPERYDMFVEVPPVPYRELATSLCGATTADMRAKIIARCDVPSDLSVGAEGLLKKVYAGLGLSPQDVRVIKNVAGTIASIEHHTVIESADIAEAINYRLFRGVL